MTSPVFYTQQFLDDTNDALRQWLQATAWGPSLVFFDETGARFEAHALTHSAYPWVLDVAGTVVGMFMSTGMVDANGIEISLTPRPAQTSGAELMYSTQRYGWDQPVKGCDHVWVDVGFFSGKQACKKCDADRS